MPREQFPPSAGLDKASRSLWRRARDELIELERWRPTDVSILERFCLAEQRAREARARLVKAGWTVRGSQGQPVVAPDVRIAREAERDAAEYAAALLLTPASRARHGVTAEQEPEEDQLSDLVARRARRRAAMRDRNGGEAA